MRQCYMLKFFMEWLHVLSGFRLENAGRTNYLRSLSSHSYCIYEFNLWKNAAWCG